MFGAATAPPPRSKPDVSSTAEAPWPPITARVGLRPADGSGTPAAVVWAIVASGLSARVRLSGAVKCAAVAFGSAAGDGTNTPVHSGPATPAGTKAPVRSGSAAGDWVNTAVRSGSATARLPAGAMVAVVLPPPSPASAVASGGPLVSLGTTSRNFAEHLGHLGV